MGDTYLARAQAGANTYTLYYDALGRCVKRKLNGVSKYYLFEGEHWIMEYDATGANISNVLYGLGIDEIIGRGVSGQPQWPLPDRNGNTSVVTTDGGAILEQYRYDAFGAPTITDANGAVRSASAIKNPFLFTGREWAPANLGFYEYRNRAYHPGLGRFMSEDPIGFQMAGAKPSSAVRAMFPTLPETFEDSEFNLYRYCHNDPINKTDPFGLEDRVIITFEPAMGNMKPFYATPAQIAAVGDSRGEAVTVIPKQGGITTTATVNPVTKDVTVNQKVQAVTLLPKKEETLGTKSSLAKEEMSRIQGYRNATTNAGVAGNDLAEKGFKGSAEAAKSAVEASTRAILKDKTEEMRRQYDLNHGR